MNSGCAGPSSANSAQSLVAKLSSPASAGLDRWLHQRPAKLVALPLVQIAALLQVVRLHIQNLAFAEEAYWVPEGALLIRFGFSQNNASAAVVLLCILQSGDLRDIACLQRAAHRVLLCYA